MLNVRDHGVEDYSALRDMDKTDVGFLSDDDRQCIDEIGRYLVEAGAAQRFALWLLHKHFDPRPGEVFVERFFTAPRRTETSLVARADYGSTALHPTAFRFDGSVTSGVGVIGMEFAEADDFGPVTPVGAEDEAVLAGVAERLAAHGKTERFGVKLIRDPLDLLEQELLLETCDSTLRTLYCDVTARDAVRAEGARTIETSWRYQVSDGDGGTIVMRECISLCIREVDGGHESDHRHHHNG
ncbi:hypothetical protein ACN27E_22695 [Mycobacterium sp. WMMD1722]|uniref:hypothetical protein n=1 Tax=Mycobacterium sp. WMMD1722 TaxID=3404117 RepID=UPI003BF529FA